MPTPTRRAYTGETGRLDADTIEHFYPEPIYAPADPPRDRNAVLLLIVVGGAIIWGLLHSPAGNPPNYGINAVPQAAPSYVNSFNDNSTNVCFGWCPSAK